MRLTLLMAAVALAAVSCGGPSGAVATANGVEIPFEDVQGIQHDAVAELSDAEFTQLLDFYIVWTVFTQSALEQFGIQPTDDEVATRIDEIVADSGVAGETAYLASQDLSLQGLQLAVSQMLIEEGLEGALAAAAAPVTTEEATALLENSPADFTTVCLAHILLETEDEALRVIDQLASGNDFGLLAGELSLDPSSAPAGGRLGCSTASGFIPEFADASLEVPVGVVFGPVATDFGYHVMRVDSRDDATVDDVLADLRAEAVFDAIDEWYETVLATAVVTVDPRYGVWQSGATARLVPPGE